MRSMLWRAGLLLSILVAAALPAQEASDVQPPLPMLHLYANLAQVPVLVLDRQFRPVPPLPFDLFRISLDSGKLFTPTRVRREGNDPVSLAVLLDVSGVETELLKQMPWAVESLARGSLQPQDQVSVYALDCSLVLTAVRVGGTDGVALEKAVQQALDSKTVHGPKGKPADHPACWKSKHLWDALDLVIAKMAGTPGRRVVLALTDGMDGGSQQTWHEVRERATVTATALFALSQRSLNREPRLAVEDKLSLLCQLTGGLAMPAYSAATDLRDFMRLVRDRYIVEFPRPQNLDAGQYDLRVSVRKRDVLAFSAGVSMAVETADEKAPENQPTDRTAGPELGSRHVLKPKN